jgi:hypothetical protein
MIVGSRHIRNARRCPMPHMDNLGEINRIIQSPLARYDAVMGYRRLFAVEPAPKVT